MVNVKIGGKDDDEGNDSSGGFDADEAMSFIDKFMGKMQEEPMLREFVAQQTGMDFGKVTEDMDNDTQDALKSMDSEQIQGIVNGIASYVGEDMTLGELNEFIEENPEQVDTALKML